MISEESCDTEDWRRPNDTENSALNTEKKYIYLNVKPLKHVHKNILRSFLITALES